MTRQDCSTFSLVCCHAADFVQFVAKVLAQVGKISCSSQILIAEYHIVFDAKPTRLNKKIQNIVTVCYVTSSIFLSIRIATDKPVGPVHTIKSTPATVFICHPKSRWGGGGS